MKTFSVSANKLEFGDRIIPSFYYYTQIIKKKFEMKGVQYTKIKNWFTVSDGEHSAIPRNNKGGIRYLYGRNIKEATIDFDPISDDSYIDEYDYIEIKRCHIKENDVLIAIYGTVGKSSVYHKSFVGVAGIPRHISNISIKKGAPFTPEYLAAFFRSRYGKWQVFSVITGNIQQLFSLYNIREFELPIPSKELLEAVTEAEKKAYDCEEKALKLINEAKEIFYKGLKFDIKSIKKDFSFSVSYQELCETNIWSTSFYDKLYVKMANALREYNGVKQLKEICEFYHGDEVGSENYNEYLERKSDDIGFIRTSDIVNNEVDLYPDYYVSPENTIDVKQVVKSGDVIFTKDGKIGCVGMITDEDNVILSSGIEGMRLKSSSVENFTQEFLFIALSIPEVGLFAARRRTVVASTIPHLRPEKLKEIEIPIMDRTTVDKITELVKTAFSYKAERKKILKSIETKIDDTYEVL